jgi:hypothetical protein
MHTFHYIHFPAMDMKTHVVRWTPPFPALLFFVYSVYGSAFVCVSINFYQVPILIFKNIYPLGDNHIPHFSKLLAYCQKSKNETGKLDLFCIFFERSFAHWLDFVVCFRSGCFLMKIRWWAYTSRHGNCCLVQVFRVFGNGP